MARKELVEIPETNVKVEFIHGAPLVVAPFGELKFGDVVFASPQSVESLLATGYFRVYVEPPKE